MEKKMTGRKILFENRCKMTAYKCWEAHQRVYFKQNVIIAVFDLLMTCIASVEFMFGNHQFALFFLASVIAILFAGFLYPLICIEKKVRRGIRLFGTLPEDVTLFYADYLLLLNVDISGEIKFSYEQITEILQTQHMYVLILCPRIYITLDKAGFVKGTDGEFNDFIRAKTINNKCFS